MKGRVSVKRRVPLVVLLLLLFSSNGFADGVLAVPEKFQEENQWCWAGASQAIFEYYGIILTQTQIAQYGTNGYTVLGDAYKQTQIAYIQQFDMELMDHVKSLVQWELFGDPTLQIGGYH